MTKEEEAKAAADKAETEKVEAEKVAAEKAAAGKTGDTVPIKALTDERGKRQALEAKIHQLETMFEGQIAYDAVGNPIQRQQQQQQQQQQQFTNQNQQQQDYAANMNKLWEEDPRKAMTTELVNTIGWYDQVNNSLEDQFDQLRAKVKDLDVYMPKIRNYIRQLPIDQRARPGVVAAAYYLNKGQSVDEIIAQNQKQIQEKLQAGESIQSITAGAISDDGAGKPQIFTEDQKKVAVLYGQTPEEYWKGAKA